MRTKVITLLILAVALPCGLFASVEEKYKTGYDIVPASINTVAYENNISFYKNNQLIFFKPDPKGKKKPVVFLSTIRENGDLTKPKISKELNKLDFVGTVAYDSVNQILYFAKYHKLDKDYALHESHFVKGKWQVPVKMKIDGTSNDRKENDFIADAAWSYRQIGLAGFKNPCLAKNGKRLYFTATIKGKEYTPVGSSDIWYTDQKEDGTWSAPVNVGKGVNTPAKEDYAFCVGDTTLYFNSLGKGGIDIFKSEFKDGEWTKAVNLGKPFNSGLNDVNFIINDKMAYLVSNRNSKGKDDIYLFRKQPEPPIIPDAIAVAPPAEPEPKEQIMAEWHFVLFYFDFDKHVLTPEFVAQFGELVDEMKQFPGATFEIAGHTDQKGSDSYNQKLSEQRAKFVKDLLIKDGFPADKLVTKGFGEKMPVIADPKTEEDYAQNRRCEIRILSEEELKEIKK